MEGPAHSSVALHIARKQFLHKLEEYFLIFPFLKLIYIISATPMQSQSYLRGPQRGAPQAPTTGALGAPNEGPPQASTSFLAAGSLDIFGLRI